MKTATMYRYYNFRGQNEVLSFVRLNDEIMDEYTITAAEGFELREDNLGIPYIVDEVTNIPYDISKATMHDKGSITAQALTFGRNGLTRGRGRKTIAIVCGC